MLDNNHLQAVRDFKALFESVPGLYLVLSTDLIIVAASDAYLRATKTTRELILGQGVFEAFPENPNDTTSGGSSIVKASFERVLKNKTADTMAILKYDIRRPESEGGGFEERYWSPVNSPVFDQEGNVQNIVHRVEDVTEFVRLKKAHGDQPQAHEALRAHAEQMESDIRLGSQQLERANNDLKRSEETLERYIRERASELVRERTADLIKTNEALRLEMLQRKKEEEQLRQSEERFRLLVSGVKDYAIVMLDPEGRIAIWNDGAERIKGYKSEEILGHHFSKFYPPEDIASGKPLHELKVASEEGRCEDESWRIRKDGTRFWANVVVTALRDEKGQLLGFGKVTRDMTERKAAEENRLLSFELEEQNRRAQEANRLKSSFLANMSHELRTPLNGIIGFSEFLVDGKPGPLNEKQREYLSDVLTSSRHLLQLINDILDLSKIEAGKVDLIPETFQIGQSLNEVCAVVKPISSKKRIQIKVHQPDNFPSVTLDQKKVKQILYNLISNAIKFTNEGGHIDVRLFLNKDMFEILVKDDGIGIKEEDFPKLFNEFQQIESGASRSHQGTGLGLALTRRLVELHGGQISFESCFGKGSTFKVTLPLKSKGA